MQHARTVVWAGLGLVMSVALIGCVTLGGRLGALSQAWRQAATDSKSDDIPLVPIPPPPTGRADKDKDTSAPPSSPLPPPAESKSPADKKTPEATPPPVEPPAPAVTARTLHDAANKEYAGIDSYIARLTRREKVRDRINPEEVMLFKFRKAPWSVYFKWLGKESKGREVLCVRGKYEGKIHTLLAAGDVPFMPAGKRMALSPDNPLVRSSCRHPISQAGIGSSIERLGQILTAVERGDKRRGAIEVRGPITRSEFEKPVHAIEHTLPPGLDPSLPGGGKRLYHFDPETKLPTLITTTDEKGGEVEYYRYDRIQYPVKLDDDDFNPDKVWTTKTGK